MGMDMAGFESTRVSPVGKAVREWRWGRFAPLYIAGILGGIATGFAIATWPAEEPAVREHIAVRPAFPANVVDSAPAVVLPAAPEIQPNPAVTTELPLEYYAPMAATLEVPVAVPEAVAPAAAAPVPVAAAQAPAAPAVAPVVPTAAVPPPAPAAKPNFYVPEVSAGPASTMEAQLLQFINAERANNGLAPYVLEASLTKIARMRSQQLIDQAYFGHRDPFGYSMYVELLAYFGYTSYAWAGENLAMNNWPADTAANEAIRGLMNSPTHRANILAGDFFRIGIGEVTTADGRNFFAMIFIG